LDATDDAPASRISSSARRELDILKEISHPNISRLLAYKELPDKTLFGLKYSRGGDLFNFATQHRELLTAPLVKRIFKELVLAVDYLHSTLHVVHRDLKLENILLNYTPSDLVHPINCPPPLIALTDLGLSRPYDPNAPLLSTRCGSTDYAAPEIMLGQPYDGRATDAWALGVILYCLLESRLPFDPPPESRRAGKVAHRIAMGQWKWYRLARVRRAKSVTDTDVPRDITVQPGGIVGRVDGEGAFIRGGGVWEGGMEIVEGLLRRKAEVRWCVKDILSSSWLA
jgi:protein-serine/threonine kinase